VAAMPSIETAPPLRKGGRRGLKITAGLLAALCWSAVGARPAAAAEWYESYEKGLRALESGKFAEAVELLEAAVAGRAEPGPSVKTYGVRFIKYYPYFHLAQAYAGLDQKDKAREMLEASEQRNELVKEAALSRERGQLLAKLRQTGSPATAGGAAKPPPPGLTPAERARIEETLSAAEALTAAGKPAEAQARLNDVRSRLSDLGSAPEAEGLRRRADQAVEQARVALENLRREEAARGAEVRAADARRLLSSARLALGTGNLRGAREQLEQARAIVPQSEELRSLERELADAEERQRAAQTAGRLVQEGQQLFSQKEFEKARAKFAAALEADPSHRDAQAGLTRASEALAASLSQAEKQQRVAADLEEARSLAKQSRIRPAMEKLNAAEALAGKSSEVLSLSGAIRESARLKARQGVALHLQGRHAEATADLEDALAALSDRPAAYLYLAVAYYARYLTGGEKEDALAQKARSAMRDALRLDPQVKTDPRLVSPRIRAALDALRPPR
jgi:tetratricopeptide (TPR) repeat protein